MKGGLVGHWFNDVDVDVDFDWDSLDFTCVILGFCEDDAKPQIKSIWYTSESINDKI